MSVNTDDPSLLGTNLPAEYDLARSAFGWSDDALRDVARIFIDESFANPDIKARLKSALADWKTG